MATDNWIGKGGSWNDHFNWDTNAVPSSGDDVVIDEPSPSGGAPSIYDYAAAANSVTIGANQIGLGIGFGGSLSVTAGMTLGLDSTIGLSGGSGGALSVGGSFFDNGGLSVTVGTVTVNNKIAVNATGDIIVDGGTVSTAKLVNSGARQSGTTVGDNGGVYVDEAAKPTTGTLDVTGLFTNLARFGVGDFGGANIVNIGTLANEATGSVGLGTVNMTVTTLNNAGAPTKSAPAGIAIDSEKTQNGGKLTVTGVLTNTGLLGIGHANSTTTVKAGTIINKLSGVVDIAGGSVTAENIDNSAGPNGSDGAGGFGVNYVEYEAGGSLNVTGTFTNSGDFGVGAVGSDTKVTIDTFDNEETGGVDLATGVTTIKTLINNGVPKGSVHAGFGLDHLAFQYGGRLTVTGSMTNKGLFLIGNTGLSGVCRANISALDNDSGTIVIVGGEDTSKAVLELQSASSTWSGVVTLTGGTEASEGEALLTLDNEEQIDTIAAGGIIELSGKKAFVADTDIPGSSTALDGLDKINGALDLETGASVEIGGDLVNNGVVSNDGGMAVDFDDPASDDDAAMTGSALTVDQMLTNNGDIGIGNYDRDHDGKTVTKVSLGGLDNTTKGAIGIYNADVTVHGALTNRGAGTDDGIASGIAVGTDAGISSETTSFGLGSLLTVDGLLTNSGDIAVGLDRATAASATIVASTITNSGLIDIVSGSAAVGAVSVNGVFTQDKGSPGLTTVGGLLEADTIALKGGSIDGAGMIVGAVINTGGDIQGGATLTSPGTLSIGGGSLPGSYTQGKAGTLTELVRGASTGQFGVIKINGGVSLSGVLDVETLSGFKFKLGQTFEMMTFAKKKLEGTFTEIKEGAFTGGSNEVNIGGGLALVAVYNNAAGVIDLKVEKAASSAVKSEDEATASRSTDPFVFQTNSGSDAIANLSPHDVGNLSPALIASAADFSSAAGSA